MKIWDTIHYARRDLFPWNWSAPPRDLTGKSSMIDHLAEMGRSLGACFYGGALILSVCVPLVAYVLIWNLRESLVEWQQTRIMIDRDARSLTLKRDVPAISLNGVKQTLWDGLHRRVTDEDKRNDQVFFDDEVAYLRDRLAKEEHLSFQPESVLVYNEGSIDLFRKGRFQPDMNVQNGNGDGDAQTASALVWSVSDADPFVRERGIVWQDKEIEAGKLFSEASSGQVWLERQLAVSLGVWPKQRAGSQPLMKEVDVHYTPAFSALRETLATASGAHTADADEELTEEGIETMRVVGVFEGPPPGAAVSDGLPRVLMSHAFSLSFFKHVWYPQPYFQHAYIGPVRGNLDTSLLSSKLSRFFQDQAVARAERVDYEGGTWLHLVLEHGTHLKQSTWLDTILNPLREQCWDRVAAAHPDGDRPTLENNTRFPEPSRVPSFSGPKTYGMVKLATQNLKQLDELGRVMEQKLALPPANRQSLVFARKIMHQDRNWDKVQNFLGIITGVLALIGLVMAFCQRVRQKTSEIGILRAFGAPLSVVMRVYLFQVLWIWLLAVAASCVLVPVLQHFAQGYFVDMMDAYSLPGKSSPQSPGSAQAADPFRFRPHLLLAAAMPALGVAMLACLTAVGFTMRHTPSSALKTT